MISPDQPHTLGVVLDELSREAVRSWHREHARGDELETALARHVRDIQISATLKPGGTIWATFAIRAKHANKSDSYLFRLQRRGPRHIEVVEPRKR